MTEVVSFYLPERNALRGREPDALDPDRDWDLFGTGFYMWILQTYLRLRASGAPVRLDRIPPDEGPVVTFADYADQLLADTSSPRELMLVSVRADRDPETQADVEIVQNATSTGPTRFHIPLWRQPGLIGRDPTRGTTVEGIAYIGNRRELDPELASPGWADLLGERRLSWDNRMSSFGENDQLRSPVGWNDYSAIDVVVALRPFARQASSKPASKLVNAWTAGVPAILSPEPAYRELRRSPLDYLEAESAADALAGLERLRADPSLYDAMVRNGLQRAREFETDRIVARWTEVLWRAIPARAATYRHRLRVRTRAYHRAARGVRRRFGVDGRK